MRVRGIEWWGESVFQSKPFIYTDEFFVKRDRDIVRKQKVLVLETITAADMSYWKRLA